MATTVCPSWRRANGWQSDFAEHQRAVGAAKTKRIFHGDIDSHIACRIRTVVKIALGITDHAYTEVTALIAGDLKPGDDVVTTSVTAKSVAPGAQGFRR